MERPLVWDRPRAARRLLTAAEELRLPLPADAAGRLLTLCELLAGWAGRINLTAHRAPDEALDRLVFDALALAGSLPPAETVADLGSGAGFPGLPLAIVFPERRYTLIESRTRKHHFQREVIRTLGLRNVEALLGRADALEPEPRKLALAQAVGPPAAVTPLLLRWTEPGGWLAVPCGAEGADAGPVSGIESVEVRHYVVPASGVARTLWIGRKPATAP